MTNLSNDLLIALAMGPSREVKSWKRYTINGYKFRTEGNVDKASINNGVCVESTDGVDYYGILEDVIELTYNGNKRNYTTILFKCTWIDNSQRGTIIDKNYKLVEVNPKRTLPKRLDEPYVLSYQVSQVYYTTHPNIKKNRIEWLAAFKMKARSNVEAPVNDNFFQENVMEPSLLSPVENEVVNVEDDEEDDVEEDSVDGIDEDENEVDEEEEDDEIDDDGDDDEDEDDEEIWSESDGDSDSDYKSDN